MADQKRCKAKKKDGSACGAWAIGGGAYCLTHDPQRAKDRAARNRRGGRANKARKATEGMAAPKIESIADVIGLVNCVIADVWELDNSAPRGRALLAAAAQAIEALQIGDLENRVKQLEDAIKSKGQ